MHVRAWCVWVDQPNVPSIPNTLEERKTQNKLYDKGSMFNHHARLSRTHRHNRKITMSSYLETMVVHPQFIVVCVYSKYMLRSLSARGSGEVQNHLNRRPWALSWVWTFLRIGVCWSASPMGLRRYYCVKRAENQYIYFFIATVGKLH